ncbi:DUF542 domain-containing protein [Mucilaginibacter sp. NFX135]|uniref:DUF542 domain-containing protein n=1 Tax=Mucilaginibacter sp. NFX135 TaxID=3402687 RepID=UPI003AFB6FB8
MDTPEIIDIANITPGLKYQVIFKKFDVLRPKNAMIVTDDHEPSQLYPPLLARHGAAAFQWKMLENGPAIWSVEIIKNEISYQEETLGKIISEDYRKAHVLRSLNIDFSFAGYKTLRQACGENGLPYEKVFSQLAKINAIVPEKETNYISWDIAFLINYIIEFHHRFINTQTRFITELAHKVAESDRVRHPEIKQIADLFSSTGRLLELKSAHEQAMLFPYIIQLNTACKTEVKISAADFGPIASLLYPLQADSAKVAENLKQIRLLTNGYIAPAYTSSTCPILYKLLAEYEADAVLHFHLKNNILFPKAQEMEDLLWGKQMIY